MDKIIEVAKATIQAEINALLQLEQSFDDNFVKVIDALHQTSGKIIVCGVGKSGIIARKIAATLSSIGKAAVFLHGGDASHGDLGVVAKNDVLILISYSGNVDELSILFPPLKRIGCQVIAITAKKSSILAQFADLCLFIPFTKEACLLNLAPTTSSTATLAIGDAIAIALQYKTQMTSETFALYHPSGSLGKRLLITVENLMVKNEQVPKVYTQQSVNEAIIEMTSKSLGMTTVINTNGALAGIFTDGDLRRAMAEPSNVALPVMQFMTTNPKTISHTALAYDALVMMQQNQIQHIIVTGDNHSVMGILQIYDITRQGIFT